MMHTTGTLWVPLEDFWPELERAVLESVDLGEREDVYFHKASMTFFMRDGEYRLAGKSSMRACCRRTSTRSTPPTQ